MNISTISQQEKTDLQLAAILMTLDLFQTPGIADEYQKWLSSRTQHSKNPVPNYTHY